MNSVDKAWDAFKSSVDGEWEGITATFDAGYISRSVTSFQGLPELCNNLHIATRVLEPYLKHKAHC